MTRISDVITKVEEWLMIILIAALLIIITLSVAFRYFLNDPLSWAGEVSIFILVWITFLGGSWGLKHNSQASVSFLIDKFSGRMKKMLVIIQLLCMVTLLPPFLLKIVKCARVSGSLQRLGQLEQRCTESTSGEVRNWIFEQVQREEKSIYN